MTSGADELHFFYDAQNRPAVVVYNGTAYAYVKSLQGDIVAILDENGNAVVSYGYDAWGAPLWCTGELAETLGKVQPFRYRGYVFDEETGLYYLRSRYYNPRWGRFVNADNYLSTNVFSYCGNVPSVFVDKNGHERKLYDNLSEPWATKLMSQFFDMDSLLQNLNLKFSDGYVVDCYLSEADALRIITINEEVRGKITEPLANIELALKLAFPEEMEEVSASIEDAFTVSSGYYTQYVAYYYQYNDTLGYPLRVGKWRFTINVYEENENGELEKKIVKLRNPYVNFFRVFNAEQIDGIGPIPKVIPMEKNEMLKLAEEVIASSQCEIVESMQNRAYYSPKEDKITLPPRDYFKSQEAFLAVTLHEMSHSTGHPDRLNRPLVNKFGTPEYAKEELNAEFGSAFLQMDLGIQLSDEAVNDHAAYLQSWISVLENDPNELFRAVHNASEISDYLIENYQEYQAEQQHDMQQKQISKIQSEKLSNSGNAILRVAIKRAVKAGSIEAGVKYLEKSELRHPDDVEGHRLVKEKFLENIKEFLPEQQEADMQEKEKQNVFPEEVIAEAEMLGFSSVEELQDKIKHGMPTKNYDTSELIHQVSEALDGNYKQENLWEANQESLSKEAKYEQPDIVINEAEMELDLEI